jgi:hypothetical protein
MKIFVFLAALFMLALSSAYPTSAQETKIKWFGHAAFSIIVTQREGVTDRPVAKEPFQHIIKL